MAVVADVPVERTREVHELVAFAVGCSVVAGAAALAIERWPAPLYSNADFTASAWYVLGFKLAYMLGVPLVWMRRHGHRLGEVIGRWRSTPRSWLAMLGAIAAGLALNLQHVAPIRELATSASWWRIVLGIMLPLVAAAIPEELAFRALLQTGLARLYGRLVAIVIATLLFTLWHLPSRYLLATGVEGQAGDLRAVLVGTGLPVFCVGLVLAAIWDRWRSFPVIVALHFAIDLLPSLRHALGGTF